MESSTSLKPNIDAIKVIAGLSENFGTLARTRIVEKLAGTNDNKSSVLAYISNFWLSRVGANRTQMMKLAAELVDSHFPNWPFDYSPQGAQILAKEFADTCHKYRYKFKLSQLCDELEALLRFTAENDLFIIATSAEEIQAFDKLASCTGITADRASEFLFEMRIAHGIPVTRTPLKPIHQTWMNLLKPAFEPATYGQFELSLLWFELAQVQNYDPIEAFLCLSELSREKVRDPQFLARTLERLGLVS